MAWQNIIAEVRGLVAQLKCWLAKNLYCKKEYQLYSVCSVSDGFALLLLKRLQFSLHECTCPKIRAKHHLQKLTFSSINKLFISKVMPSTIECLNSTIAPSEYVCQPCFEGRSFPPTCPPLLPAPPICHGYVYTSACIMF
jgi:hypothetical protein